MPTDLEQLKHDLAVAETQQAIETAKQKAAEARKATEAADRAVAEADDKARREADKADAETRKAVAEADVAAIKAFLPDAATLKPLEGTVTADDKSGIVAETVAYALLAQAAKMVADAVGNKLKEKLSPGRVLVLTERQLAVSDWQYWSVNEQIKRYIVDLGTLDGQLQAQLPGAGGGGAPPAPPASEDLVAGLAPVAALSAIASALPSIVGTAADTAGYFQSNYKIAGRTLEPKVEPVLAAMAGALVVQDGVEAVVDGLHAVQVTTTVRRYSELLKNRQQVVIKQYAVAQRSAAAKEEVERRKSELTQKQSVLTTAEAANPDKEKRAVAVNNVEDARAKLASAETTAGTLQGLFDAAKAAIDRVDAFLTAVTTAPAAGGLPPLGQAAIREALHGDRAAGQPALTHVLCVSVSSIGSETQTRERRFFAPVLRYVGSCTFSVLMAQTDGAIVYAGSQSLVGQLTYRIKDGTVGVLKRVSVSPAVRSRQSTGQGEG